MKQHWEQNTRNLILSGDGFYISYNSNTFGGHGVFTDIHNALAPLVGEELAKDCEETALYDRKTATWYILEGDFREDYDQAFEGGLETCLAVYYRNSAKHRSTWSTD